MADVLAALPPAHRLPPGRYGAASATPGVTARPAVLAAAILVAKNTAALADRAAAAFGTALPDGPRHVRMGDVAFVGIGPGRFLALSPGDADAFLQRLDAVFTPDAAIFDQSGGLVFFVASGPCLSDALAKMLALDLDTFTPGSAAATLIAHIGVTLWRDADTWTFAIGRSYEAAFLRVLAQAAAAEGFELAP